MAVGNSTSADARRATVGLMALPRGRRPTAILTGNNRCTVGALHAINGKRGRVALVGFDDFELADLLGVTVVRTDPYRIGQLGAELAFDASTVTTASLAGWSSPPNWSLEAPEKFPHNTRGRTRQQSAYPPGQAMKPALDRVSRVMASTTE